jgi:cyclophilin family peptidyl-prolyl cis-trans isomerase
VPSVILEWLQVFPRLSFDVPGGSQFATQTYRNRADIMRKWLLRRRQPTPQHNRRQTYRPLVEALEDRRLLAPVITQVLGEPVSPTPTLSVPDGKTLVVPITTTDSGQTVTYSATASAGSGFTVQVETGNPFIQFNVSSTGTTNISGTLTFELFSDLTPNTAAMIEGLVQRGFYNGKDFYRIIPNFVAQGALNEPGNTGDISGLKFDDEFNSQLIYDGNGQLGMANAGKDDNGTQLFVTSISPTDPNFAADEAQLRAIDFNNAIFGQLVGGSGVVNGSTVSGFGLLQAINNLGTNSGTPTQTVTINSASVVQDTTDAVLLVTAPSNDATGTITVTATDGASGTDTKTFNISSTADTITDPPILGPVSNQYVAANTPADLALTAPGSNLEFIAGAVAPIASASESGSTVTITTSTVDPLTVGQTVQISGVSVTGYNGTFQVLTSSSTSSSTTFTYTDSSASDLSTVSNSGIVFTQDGNADVTIAPSTPDSNGLSTDGKFTVTPLNGFTGTVPIEVGVKQSGAGARGSTTGAGLEDPAIFDTQTIQVGFDVTQITSATATPVTATAGVSTGTINVATFQGAAGDSFTATINWGDGNIVSGTVSGSGGSFTVSGSNTYAHAGSYPVGVAITDTTTGVTATTSTTATVTTPFSNVTGVSVSGTEGTSTGSLEVASFDFADTSVSNTDFTASINWGDGNTTTGTVNGSNGSFTVDGSNTYAEAGVYDVQVTITYNGASNSSSSPQTVTGDMGLATTTATLADAALTAQGTTFAATPGAAFNGVVATFTDANPTPNSNDFTASINWGDSTTSTGTVVSSGSGFQVLGSHTYAVAGDFTVTTTITDNGPAGSAVHSSTATPTSTAVVSAPPKPVTTPLSPVQLFVNRAFLDLVGSRPDSGTLSAYVGQLNGGASRLSVVQQIQGLPGYRIQQIVDLYVGLLHATPTATEVQQALNYLNSRGSSWLGLTVRLLESDAFFILHGGNNASFLAAVAQVFFGSQPMDPTVLAQLSGLLAGGSSRGAVLQALVNALHTHAGLQTEATAAAVENLYRALLHRAATQQELTNQLAALKNGESFNDLAASLVSSDEYFSKATSPM